MSKDTRPTTDDQPRVAGPDETALDVTKGTLSGLRAGGLALATFGPGVGMVTVPAFTWFVAGSSASLAILLAALATTFIGFAVVLYARRFVGSGSLYSYMGEMFGPWARILTIAGIFAGYICAIGGLIAGVGTYIVSFLLSVGMFSTASTFLYVCVYLIAGLVATVFAYRGLDTSVKVTIGLAAVSLPPAVVLLVVAIANNGIDISSQLSFGEVSFSQMSGGIATAAAFIVMFESSTALAAETKSPRRNIPRVVMAVPVGLGALFLLSSILQVSALNALPEGAMDEASPPAALARAAGLPVLADVMDLVVGLGIFVAIIGFLNYAPRVVATAAADTTLPRGLQSIHPKFGSPARAIVAVALIATALPVLLLLLSGESALTVNVATTTLITYFWTIPYLLVVVGALFILMRDKNAGGGGIKRVVIALAVIAGAVVFAWILIYGFTSATPDLVGAAAWISAVVYVILVAALIPGWLRLRRHAQENRDSGLQRHSA